MKQKLFFTKHFLLAGLFCYCGVLSSKTVVVFIHGTVLPALSMLDVNGIRHDRLQDSSRYIAAIKKVREDRRFWEDQPVLEQGLVPVATLDAAVPLLPSENQERFAVYPLIRTFDAVSRWSDYLDGEVAYYTFGHLGLLSQKYRCEQGVILYCNLVALVQKEQKISQAPLRIIVVGHSHGGNIALCMAAAENMFHENLIIDDLVLLGMPVQVETAYYAYQKPFKRVVNFFSPGDAIQLSDWLSTKSNCSFRTLTIAHKQGACNFSPPAESYGSVIDMRCLINGQTNHLTHQNFWYLGRSRPLCASMQMLPLVCVVPALLKFLQYYDTLKPVLVDVDVCDRNEHLFCSLAFPDNVAVNVAASRSHELGALVRACDHAVKALWKPTYKHRMLLFYQSDFMREMLGIVSWLDFKIRFAVYQVLKKARQLVYQYL